LRNGQKTEPVNHYLAQTRNIALAKKRLTNSNESRVKFQIPGNRIWVYWHPQIPAQRHRWLEKDPKAVGNWRPSLLSKRHQDARKYLSHDEILTCQVRGPTITRIIFSTLSINY
jgi:hypothetical protein